jgi:hypothetical protein
MSAFITSSPDQDTRSVYTTYLNQDRLRIFAYIRTLVPHNADAEDVYQHVCLTLWNKFSEFDQERDFFPGPVVLLFLPFAIFGEVFNAIDIFLVRS